jgi:hypothetical protein
MPNRRLDGLRPIFKTSNVAYVAGIILSVFDSYCLNQRNIWDYLVWVLGNAAEAKRNPRPFLPWVYKGEGEDEQARAARAGRSVRQGGTKDACLVLLCQNN